MSTTTTTTHPVTADELLTMSGRNEHGQYWRLELVRGEVRRMSLTGGMHGYICSELGAELRNFAKAHDLGITFGAETGFLVERNPDSVLGTDCAFVSKERLKGVVNFYKHIPFAPDLAVEVLSPSNTVSEMEEKIALYFAAGSRIVWVVSPMRRTVSVYTSPYDVRILREGDTLEGGDVLPGFSYELSKLFAAVQ
ncbi:MAG TPA: Uma2 family endonuclease [Pyrinomonadaceae bacterium]|jgi:Uma2 family endonuclease|nr:Uma2 family endonuclease [Pyrinomonadaceae bacterium]